MPPHEVEPQAPATIPDNQLISAFKRAAAHRTYPLFVTAIPLLQGVINAGVALNTGNEAAAIGAMGLGALESLAALTIGRIAIGPTPREPLIRIRLPFKRGTSATPDVN